MRQLKNLIIFIILCIPNILTSAQREVEYEEYYGIYSRDERVGFIKTIFKEVDGKLIISAYTTLNLQFFGSGNQMNIFTKYILDDEKIVSFSFKLDSSDLKVRSVGERKGDEFKVTNTTVSGESRFTVPIEQEPVAASYVNIWLAKKGLKVGDVHSFISFEPSFLFLGSDIKNQKTVVKVLAQETISLPSGDYDTFKLNILTNGSESTAWITKDGKLIKDISSIGLTAIKEKENISSNIISSRANIIEQNAILSNYKIKNPRKLRRLKIRIAGIDSNDGFDINDKDRQSLDNDILNIQMEKINFLSVSPDRTYNVKAEYLKNTHLIQSSDPRIKKLAVSITRNKTNPYYKIDSIKTWVYQNLGKKPTISIPNALDVLKTMEGDCNEHAVLFTALSRASNIPTKIALGIVYINGKFYYHAWNEVFIGKWITVDSTLNQFPSDATHIKFLEGDLKRSTELIKLVGKLQIEILEAS